MPGWSVGVLAVVGVAVWWCLVLVVVGFLSGWGRLARHYRATGSFSGRRRHFCSGNVGWTNYNLGLTVGTSPDGLYLATGWLFRPGHPPLFVPWADVSAKWVKGVFLTDFELRFAATPRVAVRVSKALGRKLMADANQAWAEPPA